VRGYRQVTVADSGFDLDGVGGGGKKIIESVDR